MNPYSLAPLILPWSHPQVRTFLIVELFLLEHMRRLLFGGGF
jgi:hypothetical protein